MKKLKLMTCIHVPPKIYNPERNQQDVNSISKTAMHIRKMKPQLPSF